MKQDVTRTNIGRILLLLLFIISPFFGKAQAIGRSPRIDSLQKRLRVQKEDTITVGLLNDVSNEYNRVSPYDGIKYATKALAMAEKLNWKKGIIRANSSLGGNYYSLSDYPHAYEYWLKALNISEEIDYKPGIANHLHNIGNVFFSQANYEKALEYYNMALKKNEETGTTQNLPTSYNAIGSVYHKQKDYTKAIEYYNKALAIDVAAKKKRYIASDQIFIGSAYNDEGMFSKALAILTEAKQIKKEVGDRNGLANTYSIIGSVYLNVAKDPLMNDDLCPNGKYNNLVQAVSNLDSAITTDLEIGYLDNLQTSCKFKSEALEMMENYKEALSSYKLYATIKDSIYSMGNGTKIFNLEKKEELEEKQRAEEKAKEEKERKEYIQIAGIGLFIVVLIAGILLLSRRKVNVKVIDVLGTVSVIIFFQFVEMLLHKPIEKITHDNMIFSLACLVILAALIIPAHEKIDHWMKKKIGKTNEKEGVKTK